MSLCRGKGEMEAYVRYALGAGGQSGQARGRGRHSQAFQITSRFSGAFRRARYLQTTELVLVSREWLVASAGGQETLSLSF